MLASRGQLGSNGMIKAMTHNEPWPIGGDYINISPLRQTKAFAEVYLSESIFLFQFDKINITRYFTMKF